MQLTLHKKLKRFSAYLKLTLKYQLFHQLSLVKKYFKLLNRNLNGLTFNRISIQMIKIPRKLFIKKMLVVSIPSSSLVFIVTTKITCILHYTFISHDILIFFSCLLEICKSLAACLAWRYCSLFSPCLHAFQHCLFSVTAKSTSLCHFKRYFIDFFWNIKEHHD